MKYFILHIILFSSFFVNSQVKEDYRYFLDKATGEIYDNPEKGLLFTQDLITNDKNSERIFYQHIASQSYALLGDYLNSAKAIFDKNILINDGTDSFYNYFMSYCLADQFQNLGLYQQSEKVLSELLKIKNPPNHSQKQVIMAKIYQLQAINFVVFKKYEPAIQYFEKSNQLLKSDNAENLILKSENQLNKSVILIYQKKYFEAQKIIQQVLESDLVEKYKILKIMALERMGRVQFMLQNYKTSVQLLNQAYELNKNLKSELLNLKIYEGLAKINLAENNNTEFKKNRKLYEDVKINLDRNKKSGISFLMGILEKIDKEELSFSIQRKKTFSFILRLSTLSLLLIIVVTYFFMVRKNAELQRQFAFFSGYFDKKENQASDDNATEKQDFPPEIIAPTKKTNLLSAEKEKELLNKLRDFERSDLYLSKQMSLPFLAAELDTNIKYLSEVIKIHKQKKFNAYINDLRITHVLNLLRTDSNYLNYKVSYLAEISGFSSHSAFTAIFKSITGMLPNDFIQQLNHQK